MSSAFDTVDHGILIKRLQTDYGVDGKALDWFASYLEDRETKVSVLGTASESHKLQFGVTQGSVISPALFTAYTKPISEIIIKHNIRYHVYADDTQLYINFDPRIPGDMVSSMFRITRCIEEVNNWMCTNKLMLNASKTDLIVISSVKNKHFSEQIKLKIGNSEITPSKTVKNLGVVFDETLSMLPQISAIRRSANFHLRNLSKVRKYLDQTTCAHAVRSLVLSRLDYANSLLGGTSCSNINKIQTIQNRGAKLVFQVPKFTSAPPLLRSLHWLPVPERIVFKISVHVYNCIKKTAPSYLQDLLNIREPRRSGLRSSKDKNKLEIPLVKRVVGDKAFSKLGPVLWNELPMHLRNAANVEEFKKKLKTHLFPNIV